MFALLFFILHHRLCLVTCFFFFFPPKWYNNLNSLGLAPIQISERFRIWMWAAIWIWRIGLQWGCPLFPLYPYKELQQGGNRVATSRHSPLHRCIAVSDSRGQVGIVELCESGSKVTRLWKAHGYEAWITCFGEDERVVFSGGDDCKLCMWDLRVSTTAPLLTSRWYGMWLQNISQFHAHAHSVDYKHEYPTTYS